MSDEMQDSSAEVVEASDNESLIDEKTGWHRLMVEQMAESIEVAHHINAGSWGIHADGNTPFVAVEMVNVGHAGPSLLVSLDELNQQQVHIVEIYRDESRVYSGRPWAAYLRFPENQAQNVLELTRDAHLSAVERLARDVKNRTLRWKWHREDFRKEFERIAGVSIPEPGYMQQLRDLESTVPWPPISEMYSQAMIDQMAASILAAHELEASCWSVIPTNKRIALNVGQEIVGGSAVAGKYDFVVDRELLDSTQLEWLNHHQKQKQANTYPSLIFLQLPDDGQSDFLSDLHDAHVSALAKLTTVYKKATLWNDHREDFRKQIEQVTGLAIPPPAYVKPPPVPDTLEVIRSHFSTLGLHYTDAQIATFYTALQTKGFVVLSGISGTGKSKIAQHFVEMLPNKPLPIADLAQASTNLIPIEVTPTTIKYALVNFPRARIERFPLPLGTPKRRLSVEFDGVSHNCAFVINTDRNSVLYRLFFSGPLRPKIVGLPLGTVMYFLPVLDNEQAVLTGFRIMLDPSPELEQPDADDASVKALTANHLFLSVRPDWRDSTSLLGYFNPLTGQYQWTDFLRFILRAVESYKAGDGLAWFVILDEMNLAHVEYYFADLLSVIESGRGDDGFSKEPLRTSFAESLDDDEVPPREIFLSPNFYIIGTVNMDETTHAFSPKVLDRAFTIELTEVDFRAYPPESVNGAVAIDEAGKRAMLAAFTRDGTFARIDKKEVAAALDAHPEIRDQLQSLNELLKRNRFHFGYRIFDEIAQYLHNNDRNRMMTFPEAFDGAVFMKVLPKFTGSRSRLRTPLISLLAWAIDPITPDPEGVTKRFDASMSAPETAPNVLIEGPRYPTVARRVLQMLETLETDGFVSFG